MGLDIRLTTLDDMVAWDLDSCWLNEEICSQNTDFLDEEHLTSLDPRTTTSDLTTSPWIENMTEVIEYYYDYVEYEYDEEPQELAHLRGRRNAKKKVQVKKLNITKIKSLQRARLNNSREYELSVQIAFQMFGIDPAGLGEGQFIMCDLKPVAACLSSECGAKSKIVKYFENEGITYKKSVLVADVSEGKLRPMSLVGIPPDFKCAYDVDGSQVYSGWYNRFSRFYNSLNMDMLSYTFLLLNVTCFILILFLINYLFCNKSRCSK